MGKLATIDQAMLELGPLLAEAELTQSQQQDGDSTWLPTWYLRKLNELTYAEDLIKDQAKRLLAQIGARREVMAWKWGKLFKEYVEADLAAQGGKKKSVDYLTGRAGFRTIAAREKIVVGNEDAAIKAAETSCPQAVKIKKSLLVSELLKHFKETGEELPGTHLETSEQRESFYPQLDIPELEAQPEEEN